MDAEEWREMTMVNELRIASLIRWIKMNWPEGPIAGGVLAAGLQLSRDTISFC